MKRLLLALALLLPLPAQAQIVGALPFQLQNGTTADATQVMADFNKILNDVNTNGAKNGINSDITALTALSTPITPAQGGTTAFYAATSTGTANAQAVASPSPTGFTLAVGRRITFVAGFTNTGAMTLNVNSTGATNLFRPTPAGPVALAGGEVIAGNYIEAVYDGTQYQLYTNASTPGLGPLTNLASATTTDLGTISSHNINITGTTTITSFGSTAVTTYPTYQLKFAGALTLTHNATSLILPGTTSITTAANDTATALYLGSGNWQVTSYNRANGTPLTFNAAFLQGYINGLQLSYSSTTAFGIGAGIAADSTNTSLMSLPSAYTKTTASWAVGSGNGGLDTGAIAANTGYHVYQIQRPDTGVVDIVFSTQPTTPSVLPTNYTLYRRIGWVKTNGSSQWTQFTQTGDTFLWLNATLDINTATTASRVLSGVNVPAGITVEALMRVNGNGGGGGSTFTFVVSPLENDTAPSSTNSTIFMPTSSANSGNVSALTNTSNQVAVRSNNTNGTLSVTTYGWIDRRGKL